jgi:multidrug efflux pump subunit AcrA (membrane-fusion protein)
MDSKLGEQILFLLALSISLVACSKEDKTDIDVKPRALVKIAPVAVGDIIHLINVPGAAQVLRDEKIRAVITGKVVDLKVMEGDRVKSGEELLAIISKESDVAIAGARELLALAQSEEQKKEAEKALQLAEQSAAKSVVNAPFDGTISNRLVTDGEYMAEGSDLLEIVDNSSIYFMANMPIQNAQSVHAGNRAVITFPTTNFPPMNGVIAAISPDVDPSSQTVGVRVSFTSMPPLLKPGMFGIASIKLAEHKSVMLVPKPAVYHDDELNKYFVVRAQGDTLTLLTQVNVGLMDSTNVEIVSGLTKQDTVITAGGYGLPDSTEITVE